MARFCADKDIAPRSAHRLSSNGTALVSKNPKHRLMLGQEIEVVIQKVFPSDKQLDFRLA